MLRTTATRSLLKCFPKAPAARVSYRPASSHFRNAAPTRQLNNRPRPQISQSLTRPTITSLFYATKSEPPYDTIDPKLEKKISKEHLESAPEGVSAGSSVRHVFEASQAPKHKGDDEMMGGIKADLETIKETFSLNEVPRESLYIGAAGVLPYAATSLSTVFLAWDINHAHATGTGLLFSPETAHQLLDLVTPIQIGYGAVVSLQFLTLAHASVAH